jgi:hypothetical protein
MASPAFIAKTIGGLVLAYPSANIPEATMHVYAKALADLSEPVLDLACTQIVATSKWFPTVAELREAAAAVQMDAGATLTAGEAWGEALHTIRMLGYYEKPVFSNPLIAKCVEAMGGWKYLSESEDTMADRAHFMKTWDAVQKRETKEVQLPPQLRAGSEVREQLAGLQKQLTKGTQ